MQNPIPPPPHPSKPALRLLLCEDDILKLYACAFNEFSILIEKLTEREIKMRGYGVRTSFYNSAGDKQMLERERERDLKQGPFVAALFAGGMKEMDGIAPSSSSMEKKASSSLSIPAPSLSSSPFCSSLSIPPADLSGSTGGSLSTSASTSSLTVPIPTLNPSPSSSSLGSGVGASVVGLPSFASDSKSKEPLRPFSAIAMYDWTLTPETLAIIDQIVAGDDQPKVAAIPTSLWAAGKIPARLGRAKSVIILPSRCVCVVSVCMSVRTRDCIYTSLNKFVILAVVFLLPLYFRCPLWTFVLLDFFHSCCVSGFPYRSVFGGFSFSVPDGVAASSTPTAASAGGTGGAGTPISATETQTDRPPLARNLTYLRSPAPGLVGQLAATNPAYNSDESMSGRPRSHGIQFHRSGNDSAIVPSIAATSTASPSAASVVTITISTASAAATTTSLSGSAPSQPPGSPGHSSLLSSCSSTSSSSAASAGDSMNSSSPDLLAVSLPPVH